MAQLFSNNAISLLNMSVGVSDTTIHLTPGRGHLFPDPIYDHDFFLITLENTDNPEQSEIIKISHRTNDTLTVAPDGRGYEGSVQQYWDNQTTICDHRLTAGTMTSLLPAKRTRILSVPDDNQFHIIDEFTATRMNPSCKWMVTLTTDEVDFKTKSFEIMAVHRSSTGGSNFSRYGVVGDTINHALDVVQNGSNLQLKIENKQNINLIINITRINHM